MIDKIDIGLNRYITKKTIFISAAILCFLILSNQIADFYDRTIVIPILKKIPSTPLIGVVFCIVCFLTLIISRFSLLNNVRVSNFTFGILSFWFIIFLVCRFSTSYIYSPYNFKCGIKYVDLVFIFFIAVALLKLKSWVNPEIGPKYFYEPFQLDVPLNRGSQDLYNRKKFAFDLAEKIQSRIRQTNVGSLAIGISGEWGSGKTSFCNFIIENLDYKNRIVIEFNPWRSSSPEKIIIDFFALLINQIKKFQPDLSNEISKYAKTLAEIDENIITKSVETFSDFLFNSDSKNETYDLINNIIKKSNKQIIIFIDDLDRLDTKEIVEVLRLIRNTANFYNVVYLVSYDKKYILEGVKTFNEYNYRQFLEKIFQIEFLLPKFDSAMLRNEIKTTLIKSIGAQDSPEISAAIDYSGISGKSITNRVIKTQRDVIRFTNSLLFDIKRTRNEVNIIDFYFVQLLKVKFADVYQFLSEHNDLLFIRENKKLRLRATDEKGVNEDFLLAHRILGNKDKSESELKDTFFEKYITNNSDLTEIDKDVILEIVNELLREKYLKVNSLSSDFKSFVFSSNFTKYFNVELLETDFSDYEFESVRVEIFEKYFAKVTEWIAQGKISDVLDRLEKIGDFATRQEWENHLHILVLVGKYQLKKSGAYGINYRQIIEILNYPVGRKGAIRFFADDVEYFDFVKKFFAVAPDPYVLESNILTAALTPVVNLKLTDAEIQDQLLEYLRKYCREHDKITPEIRDLYKNCVSRKIGSVDQYEVLPEANDLFKSYFLKYLQSEELGSFIRQLEPGSKKYIFILDWFHEFFAGWDELENFLATSTNIKLNRSSFDEFMDFYTKYKHNGYKEIEYEFKHLKPVGWL
jgi:KAP family P-loop domain